MYPRQLLAPNPSISSSQLPTSLSLHFLLKIDTIRCLVEATKALPPAPQPEAESGIGSMACVTLCNSGMCVWWPVTVAHMHSSQQAASGREKPSRRQAGTMANIDPLIDLPYRRTWGSWSPSPAQGTPRAGLHAAPWHVQSCAAWRGHPVASSVPCCSLPPPGPPPAWPSRHPCTPGSAAGWGPLCPGSLAVGTSPEAARA